jgi:GNAT superfamily N-acetyltransferase
MMSEYQYKPLEFGDADLELYTRFLAEHYGQPELFTFEYIKWQYRDNPAGKAVGYNAFYGDELVAHVVTIPFKAVIGDSVEVGLLLANAMTVPEHRRKGISVGLADNIETMGLDLGCSFVVGIANRNSTPAYIKGRKMELVGPLGARMGIGLPSRPNDAENYDFQLAWDSETLGWRLNRPGSTYWQKTVAGRRVIYAGSGKPGIKTIMGHFKPDFLQKDLPSSGPSAMPVSLWIGMDSDIRWGRSLYVPIPKKLRPSPLNFLFKDLSGKNRKLAEKKIFFQTVDFDVF